MTFRNGCYRSTVVTAALAILIAFATQARAAQPAPPYRGADGLIQRTAIPAHVTTNRTPSEPARERLAALSRHMTAVNDDTLRVIAVQVQFADTLMISQRDSTWFANELTHTEQYFRGASRGRFHLAWTVAGRLYSLPKAMGYYGADSREEERVVELAQAVIDLADDDIDFAQYDHLFIIHAGAGQETDINADSPNQIWSSFYDRGDIRDAQDDDVSAGLPTDDTSGGNPFFVDNFTVVPAQASQDFATVATLGIWAFELGSRIGMVPLFDSTPSGAPDSQGVGNFCLMAYGIFNVNGFVPAFPCAFNRMLVGWLDPVVVEAAQTPVQVRLTDVNTGSASDTLCVKIPITDSEYYLVTNRVHDSNFDSLFTFQDADSDLVPDNTDSLEGAEFDFFLTDLTNPFVRRFDPNYGFNVLFRHTGSGVYIWHVDERVVADAETRGYLPDDYAARKGVDLEEADGVQDLDRPGAAAFALGSHFDSYRLGDANSPVFGPDTKPASRSNAGAATGITVETLSRPGLQMRVAIARATSYADARARWSASASKQPASVVDLDAAGMQEIVTLGDHAGVFVLDESGREKVDLDANPATIAPFIPVPGVEWIGPPAFANLDGSNDVEIAATSTSGDIYVWKQTGVAFSPAVPFAGISDAAPPLLTDINGGAAEIAYAARGSTTEIGFVDAATGAPVMPTAPGWPVSFPAQLVTPLALARAGVEGLVACGVDTATARVVIGWTPFDAAASPWTRTIAVPSGWDAASFIPSAPAVGDIDHDDDDEIVIATPDGGVFVFDMSGGSVSMQTGMLSARYPSAPALGDVDGDGTLEIAIADAENLYLLKSNARPMLNWPRPIRAEAAGEAPPIRPLRELESPIIFGGNDALEVVFALDDGTLAAFRSDGTPVGSFPRPGPAEPGAAPTAANISNGGAIVVLGSYAGLNGVDTVVDTLASTPSSSLSIQSLVGSVASPYWPMARADLARTGRVVETRSLQTAASTFDEESFIIYPNPVKADAVHARVTTNKSARVRVSIYTLEGIVASVHEYDVNPSGLIGTPFDERIDVSSLKSGIYLMRLEISGSGGNGAVHKPFAIRR